MKLQVTITRSGDQVHGGCGMIEPSDAERADLPQTTAEYLENLEAENAELRHKLLDELSYLTQLTELEAQLAEARELLTDLDGMEPIKASWVERRDAWLKEAE